MHHSYLAQLDKNWLKESISAKQDSLNDVNGALTSEVISDLFVLGSGSLTAAFAVASRSLVPLALNPLPVNQVLNEPAQQNSERFARSERHPTYG